MPKTETVYDSTDIQLRELSDLVGEKLTPADLATPQIVQLILTQQMRNLSDLKAAKLEITELRETIGLQSGDHAELRIKLAASTERQRVLVLEIPIGFLSGFAISILTTSKFADPVGWILLVLSLAMLLLLLRVPKVPQLFAKKEDKHGEQ